MDWGADKIVATCEEGLHVWAVSQFYWCMSRVGGQSRVCTVIQKQPDYWKVIACYCIMKRPKERKRTIQMYFMDSMTLVNTWIHLLTCFPKGFGCVKYDTKKKKVRLPPKYFCVINCNLCNCWIGKRKQVQTENTNYHLKNREKNAYGCMPFHTSQIAVNVHCVWLITYAATDRVLFHMAI